MPIRILHIVDSLGKGGLENGLVNLIEHLDPARFEHLVYAIRKLGPNADRLAKSHVQVICQGKHNDSRFQTGTLAGVIRQLRPDIVHSRNWAAVEAVVAGRWVRSCSVVHSEHGLEADAAAHEPKRRIWFRRLAYHLAHRVLSVSCHLRDLHAARTGFDPQRITVIHNGVDRNRFCPDAAIRARLRGEMGLTADEFCVGCVGNLFPVKDHMTALKAIEGLAAQNRNWRLLLIGEGPERAKLESFLAQRPDWKTRVQLVGTSHRVPELLQALDVYVLPSIAEGISNSLLEAMASGVPTVATVTGGNPEVVIDGESGLLFPVGDARTLTNHLLRLQADQKLRADLAERAMRRVRDEFSLETMVGKYAHLYESLGKRAALPVHAAAGV